jgi:hypothetical protein
VLPAGEAVWWACQCVRALIPARGPEEEAGLAAAEAWVREPEEERRLQALRLGMSADRGLPTTWLALAAAWSGGSMTPPEEGVAVPAPAHLTAQAARAAVLIALARIGARERAALHGELPRRRGEARGRPAGSGDPSRVGPRPAGSGTEPGGAASGGLPLEASSGP